jgi:SPP1 family phage portal protein
MITRSREYLDEQGLPPPEMLRTVLAEHRADLTRLQRLKAAYQAKGAILDRKRRDGLPNNKLAHPYAHYITTIATGYLIGQPVAYDTSVENDTLQRVQEVFRRGSEPAENTQIARDQSIYGKGVEYVHVDDAAKEPMPHVTAISPESAFVVYSDTYDMEPLFGVYYLTHKRADGTDDGWRVWVMSPLVIAQYRASAPDAVPERAEVEPHYFGGVPIVEYWNNEREEGDFEGVLRLIDAYDVLQSDRVNDKEQFVDRLLVLTGAVLETDERGRKPMEQLKEDHALQLPDSQSKAEYLTSEMNENSVEVLRKALREDIHKLSLVPDLSDESFASNASGVAMRYKLLGLEQLTRIKEQWFAEGLRQRLRLILHFLQLRGAPALAVGDINITFTHALPVNLTENAQIVRDAAGANAVSVEMAVKMLHHGENWTDDDVKQEVERIQAQKAEEARSLVQDDFETVDTEE